MSTNRAPLHGQPRATRGDAARVSGQIGPRPLAGMFHGGGQITHCLRVGEDGYTAPFTNRDDDGQSQIRSLTDRTLAWRIQYRPACTSS